MPRPEGDRGRARGLEVSPADEVAAHLPRPGRHIHRDRVVRRKTVEQEQGGELRLRLHVDVHAGVEESRGQGAEVLTKDALVTPASEGDAANVSASRHSPARARDTEAAAEGESDGKYVHSGGARSLLGGARS